jgi:AcrR family transcriptional regulator
MTALAPADPPDGHTPHDRYSATQHRTIDAAMELFAQHGVSGTSFQMIADAVGLTKAAIYHQFKTKDAIVLAVAEVGLSPLEDALEAAEEEATPEAQRARLLIGVIDLAVSRRRWVNALQGDPVMIRLLGSHDPFVDLMSRVYSVLMGFADDGPSERMRIAIVSAAIGAAIVHPLIADMDDDTVRTELLAVTRRLFDIAD